MFQIKVVEKIKTHILCSITFFENRAVYENVEKYCSAGQATDNSTRVLIAYWVPKATHTHSEHVILIAFPLQQLLQGRASVLCYTYCLVYILPTVYCVLFYGC
jgi:hypothetical protein